MQIRETLLTYKLTNTGACCIWNSSTFKLESNPKLGSGAESPSCAVLHEDVVWLGTRRNIIQIDARTAEVLKAQSVRSCKIILNKQAHAR